MTVFRNIVETAAIAIAFTVGALANRRPKAPGDESDAESRILSPLITPRATRTESCCPPDKPDNTRFRKTRISKFLARFPFLFEIWYWNLTYWVYKFARALSAILIRGNKEVFDQARTHALSILSFENKLGIDIELRVQRFILRQHPIILSILAKIYYSHIFVGVVFIVYTYTYLPRSLFQKIRRTMAVNNVLAFIILTSWRCMPPRLLGKHYGFEDVLHKGSQSHFAWTDNKFQLTVAAMPSLHFGNAAFIGLCLWRFAPHRIIKYLAPLWPAMMLLTVLATANHFVLDAIVGALIPVLGWFLNGAVLYLLPLESWGLWAIRAEKPAGADEDVEELFLSGRRYFH